MTPDEHIARAEELLADSEKINDRNPRSQTQAVRANVHALLAIAKQQREAGE